MAVFAASQRLRTSNFGRNDECLSVANVASTPVNFNHKDDLKQFECGFGDAFAIKSKPIYATIWINHIIAILTHIFFSFYHFSYILKVLVIHSNRNIFQKVF